MKFVIIIGLLLSVTAAYCDLYTNGVVTVSDLAVTEKAGDKVYKAWINEKGLNSNYDGVTNSRAITKPDAAYPELLTGYPIIDMLYAMAIEEIKLDTNEKGFFVAGEKWNQAWTRDMSYAIWFSLASVFNDTSRESLKTRIYQGNILQDTGTGGSYPISTDRMIWAMAAYETALLSGDDGFYKEVYETVKKAMLQDLAVVYDKNLKLFKGEESFLDWREETYPKWMTPSDIGESFASGTNIVHYIALQRLSIMAEKLGLADDKKVWDTYAAENREGINTNLWSVKRGYWSAYYIGGEFPFVYDGYETLGASLGILSGLKSGSDAEHVLHALKTTPYGHPVVAPQLQGIPPYHNDSIWPFVQAYRGLAAAKVGDTSVFADEFFTLVRSGALFLTFKENLVASTGDKKGTQINSDRQLWSVAAYLGYIYRGLAGLQFSEKGISFTPVKPELFKAAVRLKNFKYHAAVINVEVDGTGSIVDSITVDGVKKGADYILPADTKGEHSVVVMLKGSPVVPQIAPQYDALAQIKVVESVNVTDEQGKYSLKWAGSPDKEYVVYRNGKELTHIKGTQMALPPETANVVYAVAEYTEQLPMLKGASAWLENSKAIFISEAEKSKHAGGTVSEKIRQKGVEATQNAVVSSDFNRFAYNSKGYLEKWGSEKDDMIEFSVKVAEAGSYLVDFRYQNGGPINTGEKCALKEISVNGETLRVIYFTHMGNWKEWTFNGALKVMLKKGVNVIKLSNSERTLSQKEVYPPISIDLMRVMKVAE